MNPLEIEQRRLTQEYKKERSLLLAKAKEVTKSAAGKDLIWEVLAMCGLYESTFTGNSAGAYKEGRRSIGLELLDLLNEMDSSFYPNLLLKKQEKL